jgi:molybdopterin-containing oxidoreductase family molybdopterin binding subunit
VTTVGLKDAAVSEDVWIPTACDMCYNGCTIRVHRVDGVAVRVEGIEDAAPNYGRTCAKGQAALMNVYSPNRVTAPMVRTNPDKGIGVDPRWREISWDEAMELLVDRLRAARETDPRSVIGLTFDRNTFHVLRAFLTAVGSPNMTAGSAGFFCGNGMHPVAFSLTGSNDVHPDLHLCDYLLMFGTSYGFVAQMNAMGITTQMAEARARGMRLVVVDPVLTYAASQADEWIPIRPGTDTALALGLMREWVIELDRYDEEFQRRYTNGPYLIGADGRYVRDPATGKPLVGLDGGEVAPFDAVPPERMVLDGTYEVDGRPVRSSFLAFREHLEPYTPERVEQITTVPAATVRRIAREMVEAARIGQTITLEGQTLPLRPATTAWYRGISAHKHSMLNGMAMGQLNVLLGAVDVPGGILNASGAGPDWMPKVEQDGMLIPGSPYGGHMSAALPRRMVKPPETLELIELFPVSVYARAMLWLGLLRGEEFGLPYKAEVLIQSRCNIMSTSGDPTVMAEALRTIPFIVSMNTFHDETSEFADLLLPDTHSLERLVPFVYDPYYHYTSAAMPFERIAWNAQQPVVKAVEQARHWGEVLLDAAGRLGILPDFNSAFSHMAQLTPEHRLERDRSYTWEEIADAWMKSRCGDEHGLEYFREHGYYRSDTVRSARASYPRAFHDARIPLYLEHFIDAGEQVKAFTDSRGVEWDTSDYIPLVEWKPCLTEEDAPPEYDLWVVNQKLPFMSYSHASENPWLVGLARRSGKVFTIGINPRTALAKGVRDGDSIVLETAQGKHAEGVARVTEGIHPECLSVPGVLGRWAVGNASTRGEGVHFNSLLSYSLDRMDTVAAALDACVKVRIRRADATRREGRR